MKKRGKRALAAVLAAAALCAMAPAALAADTEPPLYERMGYATAAEFMQDYGYEYTDYDWVSSRFAHHYARILQNPQIALDQWGYADMAALDADIGEAAMWPDREAFYCHMAFWLMGEEEPPLSVQLNGEKVVFPDTQPEMVNDRTMAPFRAVAEALGAEVTYSKGKIDAALDGRTLHLAIGEKTCRLELPADVQPPEGFAQDGTGWVRALDAAPYLKGDRAYVPVRFFAEGFGLTVRWDEESQAAVLYDRKALVDGIDAQFGVMNRWLAAQPRPDWAGTVLTAVSAVVEYTAFDSLDGDETYRVSGTLEVLTGQGALELELALDLRAVVQLMQMEDYLGTDMEQLLAPLGGSLQNMSLRLRYDVENDVLYLHCPLLLQALAQSAGKNGAESDVWLRLEGLELMDGLAEMQDRLDAMNQVLAGLTVGELLAAQNEWMPATEFWQQMQQDAAMWAAQAGDGALTRSGSKYIIKLEDSYEEEGDWPYAEKMTGTVTLDPATGAAAGEMTRRVDDWETAEQTTCTFEMKNGAGRMELTEHRRNEGILKVTLTFEMRESSRAPAAEPPAGEKVVSPEAWAMQLFI